MTDDEIIKKRDELQKMIGECNDEIAENCRQFYDGELDKDDLISQNDLLNSKIFEAKNSIAVLALKR